MALHDGFGHLRIGARISLGFGLVLVLLIGVGVLAHVGGSRSKANLHRFEYIATEARTAVEIDRNTAELQRAVQLYTYTGIEGLAARSRQVAEVLFGQLAELHGATRDEAARDHLARMETHLRSFVTNFGAVVEERRLRTELLEERMFPAAEDATAALERVVESGGGHRSARAKDAIVAFQEAEKAALEYFEWPDSARVDGAKGAIRASKEILAELRGTDPSDGDTISKATAQIDTYQQAFLRAVQATRGYLYLVSVVMSAEAAEFAHQSAKLRESCVARMDQVKRDTSAQADSLQRISSGITILAVLIGLAASWRIALGIVRPMTAMTATFTELARGQKSLHVPGLDRGDEIGEMAQAANIFQLQNLRTEMLLEESRRLSSELADKREELERSNEELEQFVYTVSHDLKSPLVTSMGFLGMIRDLADAGEYEQAISKLDRLEKPNRRMSQLISDLLDLSRVGREDEREDVDLQQMVEAICTDLAPRFDEHGFDVVIQPGLPTLVANERATVQVFDNLLNNALKYCRGVEHPRVEILGHEEGDEFVIGVRDNGPGIPEEYRHKVFGLFQRVETDVEGTGIGLSIVQRVMKSHGGRVWIESEVGAGTTFWLGYPRTAVAQAA